MPFTRLRKPSIVAFASRALGQRIRAAVAGATLLPALAFAFDVDYRSGKTLDDLSSHQTLDLAAGKRWLVGRVRDSESGESFVRAVLRVDEQRVLLFDCAPGAPWVLTLDAPEVSRAVAHPADDKFVPVYVAFGGARGKSALALRSRERLLSLSSAAAFQAVSGAIRVDAAAQALTSADALSLLAEGSVTMSFRHGGDLAARISVHQPMSESQRSAIKSACKL